MKRVNQILFHPLYRQALKKTEILEKDREFCRHDMAHFLDVARIAYIHCLEQGMDMKKDVVYAAALLHDIGRCRQYEEGISHETASAGLAEEILPQCAYSEEEQRLIREAVLGHRRKDENICGGSGLGRLLYQADKQSRNCFACSARKTCNWPEDRMNNGIQD